MHANLPHLFSNLPHISIWGIFEFGAFFKICIKFTLWEFHQDSQFATSLLICHILRIYHIFRGGGGRVPSSRTESEDGINSVLAESGSVLEIL